MYGYRGRSRSPEYTSHRQRQYSPSGPRSRSPPPPPRRYDSPPPSDRYNDYSGYGSVRYEEGHPPRRYEQFYPGRYNEDRYHDDYHRDHAPSARFDEREEGWNRPRYDHAEQWEKSRDQDLAMFDATSASYESQQHSKEIGKRGKEPSQPSKDVIFLGIDPELTEADLLGYLQIEHKAVVDSVKVVKDKFTGASKFFGFATFHNLEGATNFVNENFPAILMPALYAHSTPRKVKIDFSTPFQNPHPSGFDTRHHGTAYVRPGHDGMRDIGTPGDDKRVLLLRGLDSLTTSGEVIYRSSQEIARMVGKQGQEIEAGKTIVRVVLIVDKSARSNWGYAFVELATSELASALLPFLLSPQHQPNGFLINSVPVAASFANPTSFVPVAAGPLGGEFIIISSRAGGLGSETIDKPDGRWCAYWHERAGAVEDVPQGAPIIREDGMVELTPAHRSFLGGLAGLPAQTSAKTAQTQTVQQTGTAPVNLSGSVQPIKISGASKSKKKEEVGIITIMQKKNVLGDTEEDDRIGQDTILLSRTKGARIIPPTSTSRKIAGNINKWNTKQFELAAPELANDNLPPKGVSDANTVSGTKRQFGSSVAQAVTKTASPSTSPPPAPVSQLSDDFDYTDVSKFNSTGKVACLLCQRQFKTEDVLRKHVVQSDLHKNNLKDSSMCQAGQHRKAAIIANVTPPAEPSVPTMESSQPKYRDRAAERREVFNQPAVPSRKEMEALAASTAAYQGKRKPAPAKQPAPPPEVKEVGQENVGNQLLAKMGWKTGEGLGTSGEGRAEPVKVQQFESRAGLGASTGVEAGRWSGPDGWQQRAKDMDVCV
ncbi:hypothetical protein L204_105625 [Cryptococcus depauperatus]